MNSVLQVDSVRYSIKQRNILSNIFLEVRQGEVIGLLGRNGQGKTTLLNIIYGLLDCEKHVRIDQRTYASLYRHPEMIRMLPQSSFIPGFLTVKSALRNYRLDFSGLMHFFPSITFNDSMVVAHLSNGDRRILELFMILSSKSKFVLLDEPFLNLSPTQADNVQGVLRLFSAEKGILITDQLYQRVIDISSRLCLLSSGKLYAIDGSSDLEKFGYISSYGC